MGARFAGEVPSVKLGKGSVDVVDFEQDMRRDPLVGVDLGNAEHLDAELALPLVGVRGTDMSEGEELPAGRNDGRRNVRPTLLQGSHVCDHDIATVPEPGIHHGTAIVDETLVGEDLG